MKALRTLLLALIVIMGGSISASAETVTWLASAGNSLSSPIAVDQNITLTGSVANMPYRVSAGLTGQTG